MANSNCKSWQILLDEQEKKLKKYKEEGKVPSSITAFNPYITFDSFISDKEKSIEKLKENLKNNNWEIDPSVREYKRNRCFTLNDKIQSYTSKIANDFGIALTFKKDLTYNQYLASAKGLKEALNDVREDFNKYNCVQEIETQRQEVLGKTISEYSQLDKERIEKESIYERNQRIFFGGLVLVGGLIIITMFNKKK